jgi:hypothetical protein
LINLNYSDRSVTELVEFLSPKVIKEGEDIGRQSGSTQWRLSRGEMGDSTKQVNFIAIRVVLVSQNLAVNDEKMIAYF